MRVTWIELKQDDGGLLNRPPEALNVPTGCTVSQALRFLGMASETIETLLGARAVSVYGVYASSDTVLYPDDRLEILDALRFNPMDSRRRRAEHKARLGEAKPGRRSKKQAGFPV
ncbi:RnfH family protein [Limnobacter humi]|uniref:RnfH family protein n=1 Tax=Limnobacter humi TaxID=1778671 RepID=A0ABT1WER9_9BURK|nr:RnfH family protein [Limnobacter humi]MCQ8896013.1 RnfH family protein [Limnobacter humi]